MFNTNFVTRLAKLALLSAALILSGGAYAQVPLNLIAGWNLLGNSSAAPIDAAAFADAGKFTSVWKWNAAGTKWAFYAPSMTAPELAAYAAGKGYDVLTSIGPKEGFWVNAAAAAAVTGPAAAAVTLAASDLQQGWNLVSSAEGKTPSQLNQGLGDSLRAAGKGIVTAWSWDASSEKWRFFAPWLEAQGGTVLTDYIAGKGYLASSAALSAADGYWLNIGAGHLAPVPLGMAGHFVILTKAGITDVPSSAITGNIGSSPITAAAIGVTCPEIAGSIYGVDTAYTGNGTTTCFKGSAPDKTLVDNAVLDMGIAFDNAAARTTPDFTELGAGDISGKTLVPGLYKWGTGVLITGAGVTLSGGADAIWIFQIGHDLSVENSAIVTLSGGAQAKNIFWQVAGKATLGTAADFKGIILSQTLISLATGAAVNGRLYSQTEVTLQMNPVTQPAN